MTTPLRQPTEVEKAIAQTFDGWDPQGEGLVVAIAQAFANYRANVIAPFIAGVGDVLVRTAEPVALDAALAAEYHAGAADALDREADWIERRGEEKGSDIASRGVVAMGLRMAAQRHRETAAAQ